MTARAIAQLERVAALRTGAPSWRAAATAERVRLALAGLLLAGAGTHLLVGYQHLPSTFGVLSLLAGVAQAGLAAAVALRPSGLVYRGAIVLSLSLVQLWLLNVTVGLPLAMAHSHIAGSHQLWAFTLGWPGPIDGEGISAKIVEVGAVAFAAILDHARSAAIQLT